jgi:protein-tyrosine phosphatase
MIDIHNHILPGLDDGPPDWEQSLAMARLAVADGIREVVCTPHWVSRVYENTRGPILDAVDEFRKKLCANGIPLEVHPGAELRLDPDLAEKVRSGELFSVNGTGRFILVELPNLLPPRLENFFLILSQQNIIPIICHPERNRQLRRDPTLLFRLVESGCLAQITAGSITGDFGPEIQRFSRLILEHGLAHVVGTDAHDLLRRTPVLSGALRELGAILGKKSADSMLKDTPRRIVDGEMVIANAPVPISLVSNRASFSRKIFSFFGLAREADGQPFFSR